MSLEAKTSQLKTRSPSGKRRGIVRKVGEKQEAGAMRGGGDPYELMTWSVLSHCLSSH